jgi:pimeloyl-ACP methyl ester carboxylesterase
MAKAAMSPLPGFDELFWKSFDGLSLYARDYRSGGEKLPVICIPGLTRNSRDFELVAPWIAGQGRRVLAVDLRGRGRSEHAREPKTYRPAIYARDVRALLDHIVAPSAVLLGTSLGGLVTMALAAKHKRRVSGAILNDIGPHVAKAGLARLATYVGKAAPVRTWEEAAAYAKRTNGVAFPGYRDADWAAMAHRLFRESAAGVPVLDYDPKIFQRAPAWLVRLTAPLAWRSFRRLARGRPTLLLRGEMSDLLDRATLDRMRRTAPSLSVAEISGVGHAPDLCEPDARVAIAAFLARVP